jgi:hypothetical protein
MARVKTCLLRLVLVCLPVGLWAACSASLVSITAETTGCPPEQVHTVSQKVNARWTAWCGQRQFRCTQSEESVGGAHPSDADYRTNPTFRCDPLGP